MTEETRKIYGLVLNIYEKNDFDATIKVLTESGIIYLYSKGFYKKESKNKNNIIVGSFSYFEIFNKYQTKNNFLLRKAKLDLFFNYLDPSKKSFVESLFFLFQKMEKSNIEIFDTYKSFLIEENFYYQNHLITFIAFRVLETQGRKLQTNSCVVCNSNQNLYCFDFEMGGILCFKHKKSDAISYVSYVKAFYFLGQDFYQYTKNSNEKINKTLQTMLMGFI